LPIYNYLLPQAGRCDVPRDGRLSVGREVVREGGSRMVRPLRYSNRNALRKSLQDLPAAGPAGLNRSTARSAWPSNLTDSAFRTLGVALLRSEAPCSRSPAPASLNAEPEVPSALAVPLKNKKRKSVAHLLPGPRLEGKTADLAAQEGFSKPHRQITPYPPPRRRARSLSTWNFFPRSEKENEPSSFSSGSRQTQVRH